MLQSNFTQKWYADEGSAAGNLKSLRTLLDNLDVHGKAFGSKVEPSKYQLVVKENCRKSALKVLEDKTNTMVDDFRVLGAVIGTPSASCDKNKEKGIKKTTTLNKKLSKIAKSSPPKSAKRATLRKIHFYVNKSEFRDGSHLS